MEITLNSNRRDALLFGNETFRSFYDDRLTENDLKQACLELGESEDRKAETLLKLKDALIRDTDFNYRLQEEYLLRYLRYRKFDVKKAYTTLRKFYEFRKERPDLFDIPSNLEFFLKRDLVMCLPYKEEGRIIFWIDTRKWKLTEMSFWDVLIMAHAVQDVLSMNPSMQINGVISLWDFEGLTANHVSQYVSLSVIRIFFKCMQSTYPIRIKRIILVNCNGLLRGIYNAFRYLLSKKITDRVIIMGSDFSELHQYLNPRILPKKYGGFIETSECSIAQHVLDNVPYIKYERSFGLNTKY